MTGRPPKHPPCENCGKRPRATHAPHYRCECRAYIERGGELVPTKPRKATGQTKRRRPRGVLPVMTPDEFEELQS